MNQRAPSPESQTPSGLIGVIIRLLQSPQRLIHWMVFALIAMTVYQQLKDTKEAPPPAAEQGDLAGTLVTQQQSVPLFPVSTPHLPIDEINAGSGPVIRCGQTATLSYHITDNAGKTLQASKPITITLGTAKTPLQSRLQAMVVGAKKGAVRKLAISEQLLDASKPMENTVHLVAEIQTVTPLFPESKGLYRVFETGAGYGDTFQCGDTMQVKLVASLLDGTIMPLPNDGIITLTLGASQVPLGLEAALEGSAKESERFIILPTGYQVPLQSGAAQAFTLSLPNPQTIVIDAKLLGKADAAPEAKQ